MSDEGLVLGLDIGTTKTCAMIGELNERGQVAITGMGICPSTGLRKGVVVNIEATVQSIRTAVDAAEIMCGHEVEYCWPGIGGNHIEGINSRGVVGVTGRNKDNKNMKEIGPSDIDRVIDAATAIAIPMDRRILQVIPQNYIVDDQKGIRDPLNMIGVRLEAEVHIITCSVTSEQNLIKCVNGANLGVGEILLQTLASGRAVLTPEEMEMGVALIDLGGGTTDALIYSEGVPFFNASVQAGGTLITSDISKIRGVSLELAEKIKLQDGCCWESALDNDDAIPVTGVGGRPPQLIPKTEILAIIRSRMEETFMLIKEKMDKVSISRPLGAGIVLTGGGALLNGASELAAFVFKMPVRIGTPLPIPGLVGEYRSPIYSTALGLLLLGYERGQLRRSSPEYPIEIRPVRRKPSKKEEKKEPSEPNIFEKFFTWLGSDFF